MAPQVPLESLQHELGEVWGAVLRPLFLLRPLFIRLHAPLAPYLPQIRLLRHELQEIGALLRAAMVPTFCLWVIWSLRGTIMILVGYFLAIFLGVFGIAAAAPTLRWCRGLYSHVRLRGQRARIRETQTTCSVCLDDLEGDDPGVRQLVCGHCYHEECIAPWLERKGNCPVCKQAV